MRASIAAETAGVPSVSIVCPGFEGQATATARGHGFDDLALAVTAGHVDAVSTEQLIEDFIAITVDQVIGGLVPGGRVTGGLVPGGLVPSGRATGGRAMAGEADIAPPDASEVGADAVAAEPAARDIVATGSIDEINRIFVERGWSDGLPIVPPTVERIERFLAPLGHDPWRRIGIAKSSGRDMTVWSVVVNAVMAGCRPDDLPVLLAAAEILADPAYGMEHSGNTTGADALMILNGPIITDGGFNHGPGALREGSPPNTRIGRWLRLYLRNVGGFTADQHDTATFGNRARGVLAEDEAALAEIGWEPLAADFGFAAGQDVLTMARMNSGLIIGSVFGSSPDELLPYLGDGLARVSGWDLTHNYGLGNGQFRPLLVLSPVLARIFAAAGWSKDEVKAGLFRHARIPAWRYEHLIGRWSNLTAGRRTLVDLVAEGGLPDAFARSADPDRLVPVVVDPSRFLIAVAGDPNRTNAYAFSNDGPHGDYTASAIDRRVSDDLACVVPGA
ncbi:MAG: UGSC family (seleno)protein [Actinomycetota bacterium]